MKKRITALLLTVLILPLAFFVPSEAADETVPSLFHNDEAWYKDRSAPLYEKDGKYYTPIELFGMFDYIKVTLEKRENLLVTNTLTGEYISILSDGTGAAVNGRIIENVPVFRDSGVYYAEVSLVCEAVGLSWEISVSENSPTALRVYDKNAAFSFSELIERHLSESGEILGTIPDGVVDSPDKPEESTKRIYILSTTSDSYEYLYPSRKYLDDYGLKYTLFLTSGVELETVIEAMAMGDYGIIGDEIKDIYTSVNEPLDALNSALALVTHRKTRHILTSGDENRDRLLENFGYSPIVPDFHVNGGTDAYAMFYSIKDYLEDHDCCILLLDDCWSSSMMVKYIAEDKSGTFKTANLADSK